MITTELKRPGQRPNVVAIFSFRHDAHLVPDLIENIAPMVDGWIAFDDTASTAFFSDEWGRRRALIEAALGIGARWILAVDPGAPSRPPRPLQRPRSRPALPGDRLRLPRRRTHDAAPEGEPVATVFSAPRR